MLPRQLPPAPSWARPVLVPAPKLGEPQLSYCVRERDGKDQANSIIVSFRAWYDRRRAELAAK